MKSCTSVILSDVIRRCVFTRQKNWPECTVARCRGLHPLREVPFFRQEFSVYQPCLKSELCSL